MIYQNIYLVLTTLKLDSLEFNVHWIIPDRESWCVWIAEATKRLKWQKKPHWEDDRMRDMNHVNTSVHYGSPENDLLNIVRINKNKTKANIVFSCFPA